MPRARRRARSRRARRGAADRLAPYRAKRDFAATAEPPGRPTPNAPAAPDPATRDAAPGSGATTAEPPGRPRPDAPAPDPTTRNPALAAPATPSPTAATTPNPSRADRRPAFVIQQHSATRLHWDLRLEHDGVLLSWALPRGIPPDPRDNRLAVRTEDHPLEYLDFEGEIPRGSYGAGTMTIWDRGAYELHELSDAKVEVTLHGERVRGRYGLFPIGRGDDADDWMIHRMDPPADPGRAPLPDHLLPMLAKAGELPPAREDDQWGYEVKWDGVRALLWSDWGQVRIQSRTQREITARYPEVRRIGRALGAREVLLDGELVAFGDDGRPSFERLQRRMHVEGDAAIRRAAASIPVTYVAFDLLHLDGRSLLDEPYERRRELLASLRLDGPAWRTPRHHRGHGAALLAATREQGLEGVVAKRLDSRYEPGRRSGAWRKLRNRLREELVVGGWIDGEGGRRGRVGSLLVGGRDEPGGPLVYAGRVGSGLSGELLDLLQERLPPLERATPPFDPGRGPRLPRGARWVEPVLVAEVEYTERTREGTLRQPVFKGLRDDKPAAQAVRERADLHGLRFSNWDKVLWPATGTTKGRLIEYYVAIAPTLVPHLRDRPITLRRWPDGVEGRSFYEKNCPGHRPEWIETATIYHRGDRRRIDYCLLNDAAAVAWVANLAAIELHPSLSLAADMDHPTAVVFDLDPGPPAGLAECARVALVLEGLFAHLNLESVVKTSGSKGLQVYVPLAPGSASYARTKPFARRIAELLEQRLPDLVVSRMTKSLRAGKVLVDWSQNDRTKTTVGVYSIRARERPTVSTPVAWEELRAAHAAGRADRLVFELDDVLARVAELGDLFAPMLGSDQQLPGL